jgi:hypothetical protein
VVLPEPPGADAQVTGDFPHWSRSLKSLGLCVASRTFGGEIFAMDEWTTRLLGSASMLVRPLCSAVTVRLFFSRLSDNPMARTFGLRFIQKGVNPLKSR